jgi:hypothetical protein
VHYKIDGVAIAQSHAVTGGNEGMPGYTLAAGTYVFDVEGVR